jgi:DNA-binding SARP family transcriptional activator
MEDEMAKGCHGKALRLGRTMLEVDACRESTYQAIMLCHGELGQPGRVLRWYEVCREVLRAELDVEPQEATARMLARALSIARTTL